MVQAIVFDCFGVLATDGWIPFKRQHFGGKPQLEQQATDLNKQANAGLMSADDFVDEVAQLAHVPSQTVHQAVTRSAPNEELLTYIRQELKPHYKIGLLSNAGADMLQAIFSDEDRALFDAVALSYQTGHVKPDARAYHTLAEDLGVETEACIFVDDQERHCSGARAAGMQAIEYTSFEDFRTELSVLLGNTKE
ncbi:MAG TPA: HAD-IA family hydrolase [Candidatus Limnocylindrales bacterium]|nr:HAD-IA family hydrolase [Candidatus Limnocylindrales bacterium]